MNPNPVAVRGLRDIYYAYYVWARDNTGSGVFGDDATKALSTWLLGHSADMSLDEIKNRLVSYYRIWGPAGLHASVEELEKNSSELLFTPEIVEKAYRLQTSDADVLLRRFVEEHT